MADPTPTLDGPQPETAERGKASIYPGAQAPKLKIKIPVARGGDWWDILATNVLPIFAAERYAFVWPEAEALLAETSWVHDNCDPSFPGHWHIDPHHLSTARNRLKDSYLVPLDEVLNKRTVTAWVLKSALESRGAKTRVLAAAGAKRRAHRSFLGWTGDNALCGAVGERAVWDVLVSLRGSRLWLPQDAVVGRVTRLQGRDLTVGGPLDAAGEWVKNPDRVADGTIPFAVEVKNVRSMLYPYDHDVWDLIAKLADFPDVLPVMVARRFHTTTFRMFKDLGILGTEMYSQLFSDNIPVAQFRSVVGALGFVDAQIYTGGQVPGLVKFFSRTGPRLGAERLELWQDIAQIARHYTQLRDSSLAEGDRAEMFREFASDVNKAGRYNGGWAAVFDDEQESPWADEGDWPF